MLETWISNAIVGRFRTVSLTRCKTDSQGNPYISVNKYVRGFAIVIISLAALVFILMPMYMEDSPQAAIVLFVIAAGLAVFGFWFLLLKYTLTDSGLAYRAFATKTFTLKKDQGQA